MKQLTLLLKPRWGEDISAMYHRPCKVWKNGKLVRG